MATEETERTVDWGINVSAFLAFQGKRIDRVVEYAETSHESSLGLHLNQADVMPTGKTAADKCGSCFTIHSPGQTECW